MDNRAEVREFLISRRAKITPQQAGLPDALVRLSVGLEDIEDLIEDVDLAIAASRQG